MRLTTNFTLEEFTRSQTATRLGIDNTPNEEQLDNIRNTAERLQEFRIFLGKPIIITSGFRCLELNRAIGSSDKSQHVKGQAVDWYCLGESIHDTMAHIVASNLGFDQQILEFNSWIHTSFLKPILRERRQSLIIDKNGTRFY